MQNSLAVLKVIVGRDLAPISIHIVQNPVINRMINTWVSGKMVIQMVKALKPMKMAINTWVSGLLVHITKALLPIEMAINTWVSSHPTRIRGRMVIQMVKALKPMRMAINM